VLGYIAVYVIECI